MNSLKKRKINKIIKKQKSKINDYYPKLTNYIHKDYKKNDSELFNVLLDNGGKIDLAMKNARKLLENSEGLSYSDKWPATNVVKFFEEYKDYIG